MRTPSLRDCLADKLMPHERHENLYRVDLSKEVKKPDVFLERSEFKFGKQTPSVSRLFSAGNFSVITGKGKSKKTFLTSLLTSMIVSGNGKYGFNSKKCDVVIFDTEQGDYDAWNVGWRVKKLSDSDNFAMFTLRDMDYLERVIFINDYIKRHSPEYVVIDGIADLVCSINDESEAIRIQEMLLKTTKAHRCHILTVIHQNKADNFATGFLGSALIKKAETVIAVQRFKNTRLSKVTCEYIRGSVEFEDFLLDIQDGMPIIVDNDEEPDEDIIEKTTF